MKQGRVIELTGADRACLKQVPVLIQILDVSKVSLGLFDPIRNPAKVVRGNIAGYRQGLDDLQHRARQ